MVGGLADWFAVTALFRRPMGLPIPHTALIPNNKDRVGDALKDFVEENFLTADALSAKVREAELPLWLARQGVEPGKAEEVSAWIGERAASVVEDLDPEEAEQFSSAGRRPHRVGARQDSEHGAHRGHRHR